MKNLAIIGASYLQLPLIEKAKQMGYRTHVFAWAADDIGEKAADCFYPISIVEKDRITSVCREIGIDGICSISSDLAAVTVNYVAEKLGLPGNTMACTMRSTNKRLMREAFQKGGVPGPHSLAVREGKNLSELEPDLCKMHWPLIVKPTDRSGSRGVTRIENMDELAPAVQAAYSEGFEHCAMIEEFVEGDEYSVEGISWQGEHHLLAVTKKDTTGAPHFIETGHLEPAPLSDAQLKIVQETVLHALDVLGIRNSASHSELKISPDGSINLIEIGGRMGGDCIGSHLIPYSTGIDYVRAVIQVACGEAPDLHPEQEGFPVEVRFLMNEEDVREMERLQKTDRFLELVAFFPECLGKATDSSTRAGCYLIRPEQV